MIKVTHIMNIIESFAPKAWAESWDNCGLQVGEEGMEVQGILVALELTEDVLLEASSIGANLIITHHPLIFKPLPSVRTDHVIGRLIRELLIQNMALYSAHTNFDRSPCGMNTYLAQLIGMKDIKILERPQQSLLKLAVFVPVGYEERVRDALTRAGAGNIGRYSHCTFTSPGQGTFLPGIGTKPFIGKTGELEKVNEVKLETVFPSALRNTIIRALMAAHPYEEPAYDLYPLSAPAGPEGLGCIGRLSSPLPWNDFINKIKEVFRKPMLPVGGADHPQKITKVAITAGAGSNLMELAAYQNADLYLTGDIKHHDYRRGEELGLTLIDIGHFASETVGVVHMAELLSKALNEQGIEVSLTISRALKDAYQIV